MGSPDQGTEYTRVGRLSAVLKIQKGGPDVTKLVVRLPHFQSPGVHSYHCTNQHMVQPA